MVTIKNNLPKILVSISLALILSLTLKGTLTSILFPWINIERQSNLFQASLTGLYIFILTILAFLSLSLLERIYLLRPLNEKSSRLGQQIILLAAILLLVFPFQYLIKWLTFPYPLEYREAASIYAAINFSKGINLYSLQNYPGTIYLYGVMYPLLLTPFINLVNHPLLVARGINILFLFLFLGISFWIFRIKNASNNSSFIGVLILLGSTCLIWMINGSRPDVPGLFFSILGFCFLLNNNPDFKRIFLCALSCVVSFYFKQYMIFSALVAAGYLFLFVSKQKGLIFIAVASTLSLASFLVARMFFPLLYEYMILYHIQVAGNDISFMEGQSWSFFCYYWIICFFYLYYVYKTLPTFIIGRLKEVQLVPGRLKEPFIHGFSMDVFDIGIIASALILTFSMGRHPNNTYTYYGELLLPFLLYKTIPKIDELFHINLQRYIVQALILAFCVFPFRVNYFTDFKSYQESFSTLSNYMDRCTNIYDKTPLVAMFKIERNNYPLYNNGHTNEYSKTIFPDKSMIPGKLSTVSAEEIMQLRLKWMDDIKKKINNQEFDCIFSDGKQIIINYKLVAKINNVLNWSVYFWVPQKP